MTEYEYRAETLHDAGYAPNSSRGPPDDGATVEIPDDAVGITVNTFGGNAWVRFLVPADGGGADA